MSRRISNKKVNQMIESVQGLVWGQEERFFHPCLNELPRVTVSIFGDGKVRSVNILGQVVIDEFSKEKDR